jgi:putative transposase
MHWRQRLMGRPAVNEPGRPHELTFHCYRGSPFLQAERTCQWLADAVDAARTKLDFQVWAHVFMPEYMHILIYPNRVVHEVSEILQAVKEPVGRKAVKYPREHAPEWLPRITVRHGRRQERRFWQPWCGDGF